MCVTAARRARPDSPSFPCPRRKQKQSPSTSLLQRWLQQRKTSVASVFARRRRRRNFFESSTISSPKRHSDPYDTPASEHGVTIAPRVPLRYWFIGEPLEIPLSNSRSLSFPLRLHLCCACLPACPSDAGSVRAPFSSAYACVRAEPTDDLPCVVSASRGIRSGCRHRRVCLFAANRITTSSTASAPIAGCGERQHRARSAYLPRNAETGKRRRKGRNFGRRSVGLWMQRGACALDSVDGHGVIRRWRQRRRRRAGSEWIRRL